MYPNGVYMNNLSRNKNIIFSSFFCIIVLFFISCRKKNDVLNSSNNVYSSQQNNYYDPKKNQMINEHTVFSENHRTIITDEEIAKILIDISYDEETFPTDSWGIGQSFKKTFETRWLQANSRFNNNPDNFSYLPIDSQIEFRITDPDVFLLLKKTISIEEFKKTLKQLGYSGSINKKEGSFSIYDNNELSTEIVSSRLRTFFSWAYYEREFELARFILTNDSKDVIYRPNEIFLIALLANDIQALETYNKAEAIYIQIINKALDAGFTYLYPKLPYDLDGKLRLDQADYPFSEWVPSSDISIYLSEIGSPKVVAWLLDHGYSHIIYSGGNDPGDQPRYMIQDAIEKNNMPLIKLLIDRGLAINLKQENRTNNPALELALDKNNIEVIKMIIRSGESITQYYKEWDYGGGNIYYNSILAIALKKKCNLEVIDELINLGAPINLGSTEVISDIPISRKTPLDIVLEDKVSIDIIKLLKNKGAVSFSDILNEPTKYKEHLSLWPMRRIRPLGELPDKINKISLENEIYLLSGSNQYPLTSVILLSNNMICKLDQFDINNWEIIPNNKMDRELK